MRATLMELADEHLRSAPKGTPYESWRLILLAPDGQAYESIVTIDKSIIDQYLVKDLKDSLDTLMWQAAQTRAYDQA